LKHRRQKEAGSKQYEKEDWEVGSEDMKKNPSSITNHNNINVVTESR
jgi:hypothetical protein